MRTTLHYPRVISGLCTALTAIVVLFLVTPATMAQESPATPDEMSVQIYLPVLQNATSTSEDRESPATDAIKEVVQNPMQESDTAQSLVTLATQLVASVRADATRVDVTGTETLVKNIEGVGRVWTSLDGTMHGRGLQAITNIVASDARLSGVNTPTMNYNLRPAPTPNVGTGPIWGTFHIVNEAGFWEGTWSGAIDEQGYHFFQAVGKGEGAYAGLHMVLDYVRPSGDSTTPFTFTGYILESGRR